MLIFPCMSQKLIFFLQLPQKLWGKTIQFLTYAGYAQKTIKYRALPFFLNRAHLWWFRLKVFTMTSASFLIQKNFILKDSLEKIGPKLLREPIFLLAMDHAGASVSEFFCRKFVKFCDKNDRFHQLFKHQLQRLTEQTRIVDKQHPLSTSD